jgi:hypothetical protein
MRGLLSWDLRPLPDGRYDALREIAHAAPRLAEFIRDAHILDAAAAAATGLKLKEPSPGLELRVRDRPDGTLFALVINADLARPATARLALDRATTYTAVDSVSEEKLGAFNPATPLVVVVPPGGGVCLKLSPPAAP